MLTPQQTVTGRLSSKELHMSNHPRPLANQRIKPILVQLGTQRDMDAQLEVQAKAHPAEVAAGAEGLIGFLHKIVPVVFTESIVALKPLEPPRMLRWHSAG